MARYIDAEIAEQIIAEMAREPDYQHEGDDWKSGLGMAEIAIEKTPTADVVEVRHGEWLLDGRCSECLANPLTTHRTYCPSCGAKMDKNELLENPEQLDLRPISCGDENGGEVTE